MLYIVEVCRQKLNDKLTDAICVCMVMRMVIKDDWLLAVEKKERCRIDRYMCVDKLNFIKGVVNTL